VDTLAQPLQIGHDTSATNATGAPALVGPLVAQEQREPSAARGRRS
jgi:hypothetical protein